VASCIECQFQSKVCYRDKLYSTYPFAMHFQWVIDLVVMPSRLWDMKYFILVREEHSNFVEGSTLRTKSTKGICKFILEDIFNRYGNIGRMRINRGELDAAEARSFFERHGMTLRLTTVYNPKTNGKSEKMHSPIINVFVKACKGKPKQWPRFLSFVL
jgi:hypothetical protein